MTQTSSSDYRYTASSIEDLASAEYEKSKTLSRQLVNKLYSLINKHMEKSIMSIEWLMTDVKKRIMEKRAVLFVDDDDIVLKSIEKSIADEPYDKYFAKSGEDALEILKREEVHVIVVDIVMPGMDGIKLLKIIKKEYPKIVRMVISGFVESSDVMLALQEEGFYRFIAKNWTFDEDLRMVIRRAIDTYNLQNENEDRTAESERCSTKTK